MLNTAPRRYTLWDVFVFWWNSCYSMRNTHRMTPFHNSLSC
jgi:hypothetical protein